MCGLRCRGSGLDGLLRVAGQADHGISLYHCCCPGPVQYRIHFIIIVSMDFKGTKCPDRYDEDGT